MREFVFHLAAFGTLFLFTAGKHKTLLYNFGNNFIKILLKSHKSFFNQREAIDEAVKQRPSSDDVEEVDDTDVLAEFEL